MFSFFFCMVFFLLHYFVLFVCSFFFFFNDTATTEIYTLSLHDALPISARAQGTSCFHCWKTTRCARRDRKSTRLNSSHRCISYAVFCLKKKKKQITKKVLQQQTQRSQTQNKILDSA